MRRKQKERKWDGILDLILFVPEMILMPIKLIFRGLAHLIRSLIQWF
ncbi:hypothetical protein [Bacillus piscicola]|nr:hypothetical protein [Bacillus piscicola]